MRSKFGNFRLSVREIIITSILYGFGQKNQFFLRSGKDNTYVWRRSGIKTGRKGASFLPLTNHSFLNGLKPG